MKAKKVVVTVLAAALLVTGSVFGTMAYLTDKDSATNTFTVGHVDIFLDETDVDDSTEGKDRDTANEYHLIPGESYTKDPMITLKAGSENAYVYMGVTVTGLEGLKKTFTAEEYYAGDVFLLENLCKYTDAEGNVVDGFNNEWTFKEFKDGTYYFAYNKLVEGSKTADVEVPVLFDEIYVPGEGVTNDNIDNLANVKITATGYAIQASGFDVETGYAEALKAVGYVPAQ